MLLHNGEAQRSIDRTLILRLTNPNSTSLFSFCQRSCRSSIFESLQPHINQDHFFRTDMWLQTITTSEQKAKNPFSFFCERSGYMLSSIYAKQPKGCLFPGSQLRYIHTRILIIDVRNTSASAHLSTDNNERCGQKPLLIILSVLNTTSWQTSCQLDYYPINCRKISHTGITFPNKIPLRAQGYFTF